MMPASQSRGSCRACRESKAECDKKRPRCSECVSKNKPCGGYEMGHIFINVNSTGPAPNWDRSQNAQKYLVLDLASQPIGHEPTLSGAPSMPTTSLQPTSSTSRAPDAFLGFTTATDTNNVAGMVDMFLNLYYRRKNSGASSNDPLTAGNECGGWRLLLPSWIGSSSVLDTAIGALSALFIGTQYQDGHLIDQGRNMYLTALQLVQQALPEPEYMGRKDLLAATLVMSSTELFMSNGGGQSQLTHIDGATRLLHNVFNTVNFEEIHIYVLNQGLFEAIMNRSRYTFSSPHYRASVHQLYSVPRTSRNSLFFRWCEIMIPLPNILSTVDNIAMSTASSRASTPTVASAFHSTFNELTTLEQSIAPWYEQLKVDMPRPWTFATAQTSTDSVAFPLQFTSVEACTLYCLHWTSQLLIIEARQILNSHLPVSEIPSYPAPSSLDPQLTEYASLVCRSIQFCTQNASFASTENIYMPLYVVTSYYMRQGDENRMKWCVAAFARIAHEQKIGYAVDRLGFREQNVDQGMYGSENV